MCCIELGGGRGTFLEKGSPSPPKPSPSLPKTFGLIESPMKGLQV